MVTFDQLGQAYAISAIAGSAFLVFSVIAGRLGHAHGATRGHASQRIGRVGGRVTHVAGRASGHAASHSGNQSAGHTGAHVTGRGGSHTTRHAGARASTRGVSQASRSGQHSLDHAANQNIETTVAHQTSSMPASDGASSPFFKPTPFDLRSTASEEWAMRLFMLINPFYISVFLAFFGLTGLICLSSNKSLGAITLIPAIFAGVVVNWLFQAGIQWMFEKLESVAPFPADDLIGHAAVISVPISGSRVGEITYVVQAKRHTYPAKSLNPSDEFKKGSQVVISDIKDSTAYVEIWSDSFDPGLRETLPPFSTAENLSNENSSRIDESDTNV